jgi:glutathione S-transferase
MSDEIVLYRSVASRSFAAIWMLEELGAPYRMETVDIRSGAQKAPDYLRLNPMGKVPTLVVGDSVVTEVPAICLFLADRYGYGGLAPRIDDPDRAAYLRWMVFSTAVLEPAVIIHELKLEAPSHHAGWGGYDDAVRTLVGLLDGRDYVLGDGLFTKQLPEDPALVAYNARLSARPAHAKAVATNWPPELFAQG